MDIVDHEFKGMDKAQIIVKMTPGLDQIQVEVQAMASL